MKALFFFYDHFAEFEITFIGMGLRAAGDQVVTLTHLEVREPIVGESGFRFLPDVTLAEVNVDEYDALFIPGGRPAFLLQEEPVLELIRTFRKQDKWIGAICAGPSLLAAAGILEGVTYTTSLTEEVEGYRGLFNWDRYVDEDVVVDGKIITAKGNAYVEFAATVQREIDVLKNEAEEQEFLSYFKNLMA